VGTADADVDAGTAEIVAVAAAGTAVAEAASLRHTGEELVVEEILHILVAEDDEAALAWLVLAVHEACPAGEEAHEEPGLQQEIVEPRPAEGIVDQDELGLALTPHVVAVAEEVPGYMAFAVACKHPAEELVVEEAGRAGLFEREPHLTAVELASFRPDSRSSTAAAGLDQQDVVKELDHLEQEAR
jgi:hypothetical protein